MVRGRDSARTQHDQVFRLCDVCFRFVCFCFTTLSPPMEVGRPVGGTIGLQVASAAPASATLGAVSVRVEEQTHHPFVCLCLSANFSLFCSQTKVWPAPAGGGEEPARKTDGGAGEATGAAFWITKQRLGAGKGARRPLAMAPLAVARATARTAAPPSSRICNKSHLSSIFPCSMTTTKYFPLQPRCPGFKPWLQVQWFQSWFQPWLDSGWFKPGFKPGWGLWCRLKLCLPAAGAGCRPVAGGAGTGCLRGAVCAGRGRGGGRLAGF